MDDDVDKIDKDEKRARSGLIVVERAGMQSGSGFLQASICRCQWHYRDFSQVSAGHSDVLLRAFLTPLSS